MKLEIGNLVTLGLEGHFDVIIQGCNCFCRMENGLAGEIAKRLPEAVAVDKKTEAGDPTKLGTYSSASRMTGATPEHTLTVVNAYTQFNRRGKTENEDIFEYGALRAALSRIKRDFSDSRIGLPLIGAGIANGNWIKIERIILEELQGHDATIVHFDS